MHIVEVSYILILIFRVFVIFDKVTNQVIEVLILISLDHLLKLTSNFISHFSFSDAAVENNTLGMQINW